MSFRDLKQMVAQANLGRWCPRGHIQMGKVWMYVRATERVVVPGQLRVKTIDIASIDVDEKYRGKGNFTKCLGKIEKLAKDSGRVVYVECVNNPRLRKFLRRRDYMSCSDEIGFCYHWPPQKCYV